MNRTKYIEDDSSEETVAYYHNGVARPVRVKMLNMAPLMLDYYQGASGTYAGFDRFGRVEDQRWVNWSPNPDADVARIGHGYDLAGNRIYREDVKAAAASVDLDEFYAYDGLHRVKNLDRGALNEGKTAISGTPAWEEDWSLDALGNWNGYLQKTTGSTTLNQERTHNAANELVDTTTWYDPFHDEAGNMIIMPKPYSLTNNYFTATYDAWNRLVKLASFEEEYTDAAYEYDGLNQRIVKNTHNSNNQGELIEVRHFYYNHRWQCVEERLEGVSGGQPTGAIGANPINRYIWGTRYVDELVLRQRDTNTDGALDETLYALQDANFNVVALAEPDGDIVERFVYNAYGVTVHTPASLKNKGFLWSCRFSHIRA